MIIIDRITEAQDASGALTTNHEVTSTDSVLIVLVGSSGSLSAGNVTYNGVALTALVLTSNGNLGKSGIYYMLNPPVGTYPLGLSTSNTNAGCVALSILGVDKKKLVPDTSSTNSAVNFTPATSIQVTGNNSLILDVIGADSGTPGNPVTTNQTQLWNTTLTEVFTASYKYSGTGIQKMQWSGTMQGSQSVVVLPPADSPSIWHPNIQLRNINDVVKTNALDTKTTPTTGTYGYFPNDFYLNSFLHTVGRTLPPAPPPPVVSFTPSMSTLQDAFHANTLETNKWSLFTAGGASFVTNPTGAGTVYPASTTSSTDGDISSVNLYDLTGSYAFVRIVQPLSLNAASSDTTFSVRINGSNSLQFQIEGGTMFAQQIVAGSQTNLKNAPYSNFSFAWLRIREQSGTIFWETSQDSPSGPSGWSTFYSTPNPIAVNSLRVLLAGTSFGVDTNPGQFIFDNLNTLPVGLFDEFEFQPNPYTFYTSDFWYTVGRVLPPSSSTPPTLVAETELQTSQTVVDRITQQAVVSGTSVTSDHLVSSQDTVMLIFASQMGVAQALNAVTLNGVALVPLGNPSVSTLTAGAYYVVNPNVGVNVISASATLPTALELIVMTLLGVDKKTTTPVIVANTGALGSPSSSITPASANALLIDYVGSLGTSISENASQTVYFDQPQVASQAAGSIKLSTAGLQTMSWTTLSSAWVQLVVALEPANALSMWFPAIDLRNLSDVIPVNNDDASNPVGAFYGTDGNFPSQYWQNSFLHTVGRYPLFAPQVTSHGSTLLLMGIG